MLLSGIAQMSGDEHDFRIRPGRGRDAGQGAGRGAKRLAAQVRKASARAGRTRSRRIGGRPSRGTGARGRGGRALAGMGRSPHQRRVTVMARIVRHRGAQFRAAPLARHISYLERDGVTRDGRDASMFDADGAAADRGAFADRCADDRHHFRFIVSPEDAGDLADLRTFPRELLGDMERDLDTRLDWIAVDHWNTDNPHIHILVRGVADDGSDLVIDRAYVAAGIRGRAEERATLELGPRTERDIADALAREVTAERWTSLDRELQSLARDGGIVDLHPDAGRTPARERLLLGRTATLERLGLAAREADGRWAIDEGIETKLRAIAERGDIIKTMHRAAERDGLRFDPSALALHTAAAGEPVIGRLVARGLDDELAGSAFAVIDGADGRLHHLRFDNLELTGDARPGAIVELRQWDDRSGTRQSLAIRSDLSLAEQVTARGATWLDRQLVARDPVVATGRFGLELRAAADARRDHLAEEGLAHRRSDRTVFESDLLPKLEERDLGAAVAEIAERTGLPHRPSAPGDYVSGIYRERMTLASGRFAMIDDGLGFQLVP